MIMLLQCKLSLVLSIFLGLNNSCSFGRYLLIILLLFNLFPINLVESDSLNIYVVLVVKGYMEI